tara:strand:+ start:563 stop:1513 length:951 start_codon:yes stop_codon:yes gene_type:complete
MAYADDVVLGDLWHKLGTRVDHAMTSTEALDLAGLDWTVEKVQLQYPDGAIAHDDYGIRRESDGRHFGRVGSLYEPYQNREAFDWMDSLVQDDVMRYESAMALRGGALVVLLGRMQEDWKIGPDLFRTYLMVDTSHDGSGAVHITPTSVRAICHNTWKLARKDGEALSYSVRHTSTMTERLKKAAEAYAISTSASRKMQDWLGRALDTDAPAGTSAQLMDSMFGSAEEAPTPRRAQAITDRRSEFVTKFVMPEYAHTGATVYTLFNAATGYADWALKFRGDERTKMEKRFIGSIEGAGSQMKQGAVEILSELVGTV